jgi:hypothetical protein
VKSQADTSDIIGFVAPVKSRARQRSLAMHYALTIKTSFGLPSLPPRPMLRVSPTPTELHTLIRPEHEGRIAAADDLARRAVALREAAR